MFGFVGLNPQGRLFCQCNSPYPRYHTIPCVYPLVSFPWIKWSERNISNIRSQINNSPAFIPEAGLLYLIASTAAQRHTNG